MATQVIEHSGHTARIEKGDDTIRAFLDNFSEAAIALNADDEGFWHDPSQAEFSLGDTIVASTDEDAMRYVVNAAREEMENMQ